VELKVDKSSPIHNRLLEVEKSALQASGLTQQLLTFAKGGEPVKAVVSIGDLIKETACFALRGSNVKCGCCVMPEDLWTVDADEGQISQVINNLTLNADQAMPEGGVLKVCAENRIVTTEDKLPLKDGRYVMMSFEDQGIGIPNELLAKIFDPYYTTKKKGSGLGLASSYSIIKKHGGHIEVTSEVGVGTTFGVYLPASEQGVAETKKEAEIPISVGGRVLVMDDEEIIRNVATAILTSMSYEVKTAKEGAEAIRLYKDARDRGEPFDAVIMDLTIPGGLGCKEAVKGILEYDPEAKLIVSSGYSNNPVMANFKEHGFSGVLIKPYKASELGAKVHQVITQKD
jgi:CheY-like chemotaxis protein